MAKIHRHSLVRRKGGRKPNPGERDIAPQRGDLLFVYGTLRRGGPMFRRLRLGVRLASAGPARMHGALASLGAYPAFDPAGRGLVHGELYRVLDPRVIAALDAYEEFDPADPDASLFVRARIPLAGRRDRAWVYLYNGTKAGVAAPSGRWRV